MNKKLIKRIILETIEENDGYCDWKIIISKVGRYFFSNHISIPTDKQITHEAYMLEKEGAVERIVEAGTISYRLTPWGHALLSSFYIRTWFHFKNNVALYTAVFSIFLGIISVFYTIQNTQLERKSLGVDLNPHVAFEAYLNKSVSRKEKDSYFSVKNFGPIEAKYVNVDFTAFDYDKIAEKIVFSMHADAEGQNFDIGDILPMQRESFIIDGKYLQAYIKTQILSRERIIEARVSYRREWDKKHYVDFYYYFVNSDGEWEYFNEEGIGNNTNFEKMKKSVDDFKLENSF